MPDHKNQHYVPRCVLKPFTLDGYGKAINLYSFASDKLIRCAPVKSQCARDYFYGADGQLETALAQIEGQYAESLRKVVAKTEADDDLDLLRFFAYLQLRRTEIAIQRVKEAGDAMLVGVPEDVMPPDTIENIMITSLGMCVEMQPLISDLKVRIVENHSNLDFVTSDDPAISTNKWMCQKSLESEGFGTMSSGFILVMPLTPRLALLCYDGLVYTIPTLQGGRVILKSDNDVVGFMLICPVDDRFVDWRILEWLLVLADKAHAPKIIRGEKSGNRARVGAARRHEAEEGVRCRRETGPTDAALFAVPPPSKQERLDNESGTQKVPRC